MRNALAATGRLLTTPDPFDPDEFVPELKESGLPVFVFSLTAIELLTRACVE